MMKGYSNIDFLINHERLKKLRKVKEQEIININKSNDNSRYVEYQHQKKERIESLVYCKASKKERKRIKESKKNQNLRCFL